MPQYRYEVYNNQHPGIVQEKLDQMALQGWTLHTVLPNGTAEFQVVWQHAAMPGEPLCTEPPEDTLDDAPPESGLPAADDPVASILGTLPPPPP